MGFLFVLEFFLKNLGFLFVLESINNITNIQVRIIANSMCVCVCVFQWMCYGVYLQLNHNACVDEVQLNGFIIVRRVADSV